MNSAYGCPESEIAHYTCHRAASPIAVDGDLEKPAWQQAPRSPRFVDMVSGEPGWYDSRAAALWDDECLYVGFWLEEPYVRASVRERDGIVFADSDVEVFIDGGDCYYEFEINALGTIYEVFFIWQDAYARGGRFDVPEFDLHTRQAFTFGGDCDRDPGSFWWGRHPRKCRWAFLDWDFPGLRSEVKVHGKINDLSAPGKGWSVELAFPWQGMSWLASGRPLPPKDGDVWSIFFGRFLRFYNAGREVQPHPAWAWSRHGVYDTHLPECFTRVHFSTQPPPSGS